MAGGGAKRVGVVEHQTWCSRAETAALQRQRQEKFKVTVSYIARPGPHEL